MQIINCIYISLQVVRVTNDSPFIISEKPKLSEESCILTPTKSSPLSIMSDSRLIFPTLNANAFKMIFYCTKSHIDGKYDKSSLDCHKEPISMLLFDLARADNILVAMHSSNEHCQFTDDNQGVRQGIVGGNT